jgi:hypothetical protein
LEDGAIMPTKKESIPPGARKFTKEQLLSAAKYQNRRDVLTVILKDGKTYSHADVEKKLEEFMKGKVK